MKLLILVIIFLGCANLYQLNSYSASNVQFEIQNKTLRDQIELLQKDLTLYKASNDLFQNPVTWLTWNEGVNKGLDEICIKNIGNDFELKLITGLYGRTGIERTNGIWSSDCTTYIYGVSGGLYKNGVLQVEGAQYSGIWMYDTATHENSQLINKELQTTDIPYVHRFVTESLISADNYIVNLESGDVISQIDSTK